MMLAEITDLGTGLWIIGLATIFLVVLANALPGRYFRWRVSRKPLDLDKMTQAEFDWCFNLTGIIIMSAVNGLLWAMEAIQVKFDFWIEDIFNEHALPAAFMFLCYIALYFHTGKTHLSKPAIWAYIGVTLLSFLLGHVISVELLAWVPENVMVSVYGSQLPFNPENVLNIYAILGWFAAPDFNIFLVLTSMATVAVGFFICQVIETIIQAIKLGLKRVGREYKRTLAKLDRNP
nr:hypothetical protein [Candidatus Sigynarchaeota archaeon]